NGIWKTALLCKIIKRLLFTKKSASARLATYKLRPGTALTRPTKRYVAPVTLVEHPRSSCLIYSLDVKPNDSYMCKKPLISTAGGMRVYYARILKVFSYLYMVKFEILSRLLLSVQAFAFRGRLMSLLELTLCGVSSRPFIPQDKEGFGSDTSHAEKAVFF